MISVFSASLAENTEMTAECATQVSLIFHEQNFLGPYTYKSIQLLNFVLNKFGTSITYTSTYASYKIKYSGLCSFFICLVLWSKLRSLEQKAEGMWEGN